MIVYVAALLFTFALAARHSDTRDTAQNNAVRAGCMRIAQRDALMAHSAKTEALRNGILATIPAPPGWHGNPALAEIVVELRANGTERAILTNQARLLQAEGCRLLFP